MALSEYTGNTNYISGLDDLPNDVGGLTAAQLKAMFDRFGTEYVEWFNETHLADVLAHMPKKNLLINWDFRRPVNQRGLSSYSTTLAGGIYTIDMWKIRATNSAECSLTVNDGSLTFSTTGELGTFAQILGYPFLIDTEVTFSISHISGSGTIRIRDSDWNTYATKSYTAAGIHSVTAIVPAGKTALLQVMATNANSSITFDMVKLEVGAVSTLAYDPPANYGEQLALCQRYGISLPIGRYSRACYAVANTLNFLLPLPASPRTTTGTIESGTFSVQTLAGVAQTGFTFTISSSKPGSVLIQASKTAHGLTDASLNISAAVFLSWDI